jgi:hypothetical protein
MLSSGVDGCELPELADISSKLSELPLEEKQNMKNNCRLTQILEKYVRRLVYSFDS